MATSNTIPMLYKDGTAGLVPAERAHEALATGDYQVGFHVEAPDGSLGVVPAERLKEALATPGYKLHQAAQPSDAQIADATKPELIGQGVKDAAEGVSAAEMGAYRGAAKSAGQVATTVARGIHALPGGEHVVPQQGIDAAEKTMELHGGAEHAGAALEQIGEFALGEEGLRGLTYGARLQKLAPLMKQLEQYPRLLKVLSTAVRQFTVGTAQAGAHGESAGDAAIQGAAGAGAGALAEGAGSAVQGVLAKVAPRTAEIAGETVPKLASQEPGAPALAGKVARIGSEPEMMAAQQGAAQRGIEKVAGEAGDRAKAPLMNDTQHFRNALQEVGDGKSFGELQPGEQSKVAQRAQELKLAANAPAARARSFGEAAEQARAQAAPVFQKLDQASGGEFSKLKAARQEAWRARDFAKLNEVNGKIDELFRSRTGALTADELTAAKQVWRSSKILDDVHEAVEGSFNVRSASAAADAGVQRGVSGDRLQSGLNRLFKNYGATQLEAVLSKDGLANLHKMADLLSTPQRQRQFGNVVGDVAMELLPKRGMVGATLDEARRMVLHKAATDGHFNRLLSYAVEAGASPRVYAPLLATAIREGQKDGNGQ